MKRAEIERIKHTWTKYGRTNTGIEKRLDDEPWCCQVCGEEQPAIFDPYFFSISSREYIKICSKCQNNVIKHKIISKKRLYRICKDRIYDDFKL